MRRKVWWIVAIVILVVLLAPVAWYLGSPLFINKTVDDPFPTTSAPAQEVFSVSSWGAANDPGW